MKRGLIYILLFLAGADLGAQSITIRDRSNFKPIKDVFVYSKDMQATSLSDSIGRLDLRTFDGHDTLIFQHPSFERLYLHRDSLVPQSSLFLSRIFHKIQTIEIKEHRWREYQVDAAHHILSIDSKTAALENPQTGADLLATSGQVYVQKSQMGGGSPMIRGFSANRVLLVLDDIRVNNAIFRSGNLQNAIMIDPLNIDETKVIFGPGSAIYGSDALGAVMSFRTMSPKIDTNKNITASIFGRWSSANNEKTIHSYIGFNKGKFASLTNFTISDYDGLKMGSNGPDDYLRKEYIERINGIDSIISNPNPQRQLFTNYQQINFSQKLLMQLTKKSQIQYTLYFTTSSNIPRYDRLIETRDDTLRNAEWYYGPQKLNMHTLKYSLTNGTKAFDSLQFSAAYQAYTESRHDRRFQSNNLRHRTENLDVITGNLSLIKNFDGNISLYYGAETNLNEIKSKGESEDITEGSIEEINSRYPESTWNSFAAYASLIKKTLKATYQGSIRYNFIHINAIFDTLIFPYPFAKATLDFGSLSGGIGANFKLTESLNIFSNFSSGFRAPNIDDLGKIFDSEPGNVVVPNDELKPENSYNLELGLKLKNEVSNLQFGFYTTYLDNAIVTRDFSLSGADSIIYDGELSRVQALQNATFAYIYGGYLSFKQEILQHLSVGANINYQKGFEQIEDQTFDELRHIAPTFGDLRLTYSKERIMCQLSTRFMETLEFKNMAESEKTKSHLFAKDGNGDPHSPAWFIINFNSNIQVYKNLKMGLSVENIFDRRYRTYSSGISAPGRNFICSLKWTF
ncbi:MAG: TonB-dependent receptor [Flavobacteriales bacterium]|nr:TonB-dependent receptor [Flavobacteriales bacterium]